MKSLRLIIMLVVIAVAAGVITWVAISYKPGPKVAGEGPEKKEVAEANQPEEAGEAEEGKEPEKAGEGEKEEEGDSKEGEEEQEKEKDKDEEEEKPGEEQEKVSEDEEPNEPNDPMEKANLKNVEMKKIIDKLADWTDKTIIPTKEAMDKKITIYSKKELPQSKVLSLIYSSLRIQGIVAETTDDTIYLKELKDAKLMSVPMVPADIPLASIENRNQVVRKIFRLENYRTTEMAELIKPFVNEYGHVSAEGSTRKLLVIDTVENLLKVSRVIYEFDVPEAERSVTDWIYLKQADPSEVVQVLRILLSEEGGGDGGRRDRDRRRRDRNRRNGGSTESVVIGPSGSPVVLIPEPKQKMIIAKASPDDMQQIRKWIEKLDHKAPIKSEYETIPIVYANIQEVAEQLNEMLQDMLGGELKANVVIQPMQQARQLIVYGSQDVREMVKKLVAEVDIPTGDFMHETIELKHADPEQIKKNVEELYGEDYTGYRGYYYYRYYLRNRSPSDMVKVITFPSMQQITLIASPDNMVKIKEQINKWDTPIDPNKVKPLIITLNNTDPVKMAQLMNDLFSEDEEMDFFDAYLEARYGVTAKNIMGPLYGKLMFREVPGTKKLVVISKVPEAYKVVEEFVYELDEQEIAEVPKIVTLNYADPEDLCVRLNAMFNAPGTQAPIWFTETGLSASKYSMGETTSDSSNPGGDSGKEGPTRQKYDTPWSGASRREDQMPISNIIGRIRFIPDPHTKSILVLSPREYVEPVVQTIKDLDRPGKQVRIRATILEVDHRDLTTLGVQLAADQSVFGSLSENEILALTQLTQLSTHGSASFTDTTALGAEGESGLAFRTGTAVTALIDFLVKKIDARILNQQTLWTKDNQEANFFKGQTVPFETGLSESETGGRITRGIEFQRVGMELRVRPKITPENNVDMIINLVISQLTPEQISGQRVRNRVDTETKMIVDDAETLMLGGMLFQEDSVIERKIPLLGDIPILGGLFRHSKTVKANTETLVFVTPYVVDEKTKEQTKKQLEKERERLKRTLEELNSSVGREKMS